MRKRIISACLLIVFVLSNLGYAYASESTTTVKKEEKPETTASLTLSCKSAMLMEASTGKILYEDKSHEKFAPASITKIMTLLLVMEALDAGKIKLTDMVTCSEHAASMGGSQIWLEPGEQMCVDDLLKATAVNSANDATVALAEFVGGSHENFVTMMNERAKQLGMNDTTFLNANGLDADGHLSSANDIAVMSKELLKHKKIFDYTTIWQGSLRGGKTELTNTNRLIRFYNGANGMKTGSTDEAGCCLSGTALRNNMQLIAVVMGAPNSKDRFASAQKLLDYGFANYAVINAEIPKEIPKIKVLKGAKDHVKTQITGNVQILIPKGQEKSITMQTKINENVMAPVENGQVLGEIFYMVNGQKVGSVQIKATESIAKMTFFKAFGELAKAFFN